LTTVIFISIRGHATSSAASIKMQLISNVTE